MKQVRGIPDDHDIEHVNLSLENAKIHCKVRGYICRKSDPYNRFYKNSSAWMEMEMALSKEDQLALDWITVDPVSCATSLGGDW